MIIDFPKLHSPFIRETINDLYLVTTKIDEDHKWVFEDKVVWAVDKLDGTNICIRVKDGLITNVFNPTTEKYTFATTMTAWEGACMEGIAKAIQRGWLKDLGDGDHCGELIGEMFNGNRHQLQGHLFVPFSYLKKHCFWKSFIGDKYPRDFETMSSWFKEIPSLFNQRLNLPPILAEGLVFYSEDGSKMCKLRRDMFDWYEGERHKEVR